MKKIVILFGVLLGTGCYFIPQTQAQERIVKTKTRIHHPWSKRAKGAAIGGGAGAVIGGVADHSVKGALIGGALGAGAGYIIGNESRGGKERPKAYRETKRKVIYR